MKRCPKCGKAYEDNWEVCLKDGTMLLTSGAGTRDSEIDAIKRTQDIERKKTKMVYWKMSFISSIVGGLFIYRVSGNPFEAFSLGNGFGHDSLEAIMYNLGTLMGIFFVGMIIALPIWSIWKTRRDL